MKKLCFAFAFLSTVFLSAQVTIKDDAKVGLLVTGTGNTINTTQIFGKSPEYAELKKRLDGLQAAITQKAEECGQMEKDALPAKYRDNCRTALIALNAERDSVQKIEARFREDVLRLAETFANIPLNSERLRLAKQLFEEGKIREADNILNAKEMQQEGDALLAKKERAQQTLQMTDSLLRIKADEFALKAWLKATDYGDSLRYDSAVIYFEQSRRYAETVENLWEFAELLYYQNQSQRGIGYLERALQLTQSESEEAKLAMRLGIFYQLVQKMEASKKMHLRSLEIYDRLAKSNPAKFEADLARTTMNLGSFYYLNQELGESEKMYLRSLEIYDRLAKSNPAQFEADLAMTTMNLGTLYKTIQNVRESERLYLRSLEIYDRLAQSDPVEFETDLATTAMNLGVFYADIQKMEESERLYLRSLEIYDRLAQSDPVEFEADLASTAMNLGRFYADIQKMEESEKMYLRSLEIYKRLARSNPAQFEADLAKTEMNLGNFYSTVENMSESEKMYQRSLEIYERLAKSNPAQFEAHLARTVMNLGIFYRAIQKLEESEKMYLRSLEICERLVQSNPAQFEPDLTITLNNLGYFYQTNQQFEKAEEMYIKSIILQKRAVAEGFIHLWPDLDLVYNNMASLRDSFINYKDYTSALSIQRERAECMYQLRELNIDWASQAADDYNELTWYYLLAKQYKEAESNARKVIEMYPNREWYQNNLAHALLLQGKYPEAESIYLKIAAEGITARLPLVQELDKLEKVLGPMPELANARAWLKD